MRSSQITAVAIAAFFTVTSSAFAQTKSSDTASTQTFAGCLMTERDYRSAHKLGAGTVGGTGLGDEFVLVDVKVSPAKAAAAAPASDTRAARAEAQASAPGKCADQGTAYRLTGSGEEQLKTLVGRHVEIQGRFKDPTDAREGEKLPNEVEMISFRVAPAPASTIDPASPALPVQGVPPPPPPTAPAVDPARGQTPAPTSTARRELPATASSTGLVALIGVLALSAGLAVTVIRRRIL